MSNLKIIRMTQKARAAVEQLGEPEFYAPIARPGFRSQAVVRWIGNAHSGVGAYWGHVFNPNVIGVEKRSDGRWCWVLPALSLFLGSCASCGNHRDLGVVTPAVDVTPDTDAGSGHDVDAGERDD